MSPELHLADALAAAGKPVFRAYTSGDADDMAASMGVSLIAAGVHSRVLVVAFEKQSEGHSPGATLQHVPFEARWQGGNGKPLRRPVPGVHSPLGCASHTSGTWPP